MKRVWNIIQAADIKYLRAVKGCTRADQLQMRTCEMSRVSSLHMKKLQNIETTGKYICKG
jgi:hypothetical protein